MASQSNPASQHGGTGGNPNSPRDFNGLWDEALQHYQAETGKDLLKLPIAKDFPSRPASADDVIKCFRVQNETFEAFRTSGKKMLSVLKPIAHFVRLFIDAGAEAAAASNVVPGGKAIFVAVGALLQVAKDVSVLYDDIERLFRVIVDYLNRVSMYLQPATPPAPHLMDILVRAFVQVLHVLAVATRYCDAAVKTKSVMKKSWNVFSLRARDYLGQLIGDEKVNIALEELDELTNAELLAAVAQTNAIVREIHPWLEFIYESAVLDKICSWLRPPTQQHLVYEKKRQAGSCSWFFDRQFELWKEYEEGVYWVYGNAGAGKSVLSSSVIDTLKADSGLFLAFFYFDFSDPTSRDFRALVSSLVSQLAASSDACLTYLQRECSSGRSDQPPTYEKLLLMLSELLCLSGRTFIVIDALDECPKPMRDEHLSGFLQHLYEIDKNKKDLHVFVTSRPETDIRTPLSHISHRTLSFHDAVQHKAELECFIETQLSAPMSFLWPEELRVRVKKTMERRSNGMFLWVALQSRHLRNRICQQDVEDALLTLPSDLNATYERMLAHPVSSIDRSRRVFECLASAKRSLRLDEVIDIFSVMITATEVSADANFAAQINDPERLIREQGVGLLDIVVSNNNSRVQFIHFSVQEYLMSSELRNSASRAHLYSFDEHSATVTLAKVCLVALDVNTPLSNMQKYADRYWDKHVTSRNEEALDELLGSFLRMGSPSFTRWVGVQWPSSDADTVFHCAARLGLCRHVETMLKNSRQDSSTTPADALIKTRNSLERTALHVAAGAGQTDMCRLLLDHGALADDTDDDGETPLHRAAWDGSLDVVRLLLENTAVDGADPVARCRARDHAGWTALYRAARIGLAEVARLLLSHGALVDDADYYGRTPLHRAEYYGHIDVVRVLLEHRAKSAPPVPPLESKLCRRLRKRAEKDPANGPWRAIVADFASQFEAVVNADDT